MNEDNCMCEKCEITAIALGKSDIDAVHSDAEINRAFGILSDVTATFAATLTPESFAHWLKAFVTNVAELRNEWIIVDTPPEEGVMIQ